MELQFHNGFLGVQTCQATRLIVRDRLGNPVVVVLETDANGRGLLVATADNPSEFNGVLRSMGLNDTIVVHDVEGPHESKIRCQT